MPSSIQLYSQAINDFKKLQTNLYEKQAKIGADSKAATFAELDSSINTVESFKSASSRSTRFINTIESANRKLDTGHRAMSRIIDLAVSFKEIMILEQSANSEVNDLSAFANTTLDSLRDALNSKDGANFVFSGSKTNLEPVNDLKQNSSVINGEPSANYYNGDNFKSSVDVSQNLRVEYGVTASDDAFQDLIAAINLAKQAESSGPNADFEEADTMLNQAIEDLIALQAKMGNNAKIFEDSIDFHSRAKNVLEQKISEETSPDIVQLSIEVSQANAVLQASFQNFSRVSSLSLTEFI